MALAPFLLYFAFSLSFILSLAYDGQQDVFSLLATIHNHTDPLNTCDKIAMAISVASQVSFPSTPEYFLDVAHPSASSSEVSACSVEAGSTKDVGEILRVLGSTRTPFAVKGGGHATNPKFSSTTGVQVALSRFNDIKVNFTSGTVEIGAGLTWDQVYAYLEPTGVNVVGARAPTVGVAGFTLGGGYAFTTNQYGLTIDNVAGYELVLPNGTVLGVTSKDEDLWFGLRGGMNNFGIVTKFIFKSYPQSLIWGGFLFYSEDQLDAIKMALLNFQEKNDTKATVVVSVVYSSGSLVAAVGLYYDAPSPSRIFDEFLEIPTIGGNATTSSFFDFVQSVGPMGDYHGLRVISDDAPVARYSSAVFDAFVNQTKFWGARLHAQDEHVVVTSILEPFDKGIFSHGDDSAYPPDRSQVVFPSAVIARSSNASLDDTMAFALRNMSDAIHSAALADGQKVSHAAKYPNYALYGTPLEHMYGRNVERLRKIRAVIDPDDVMGLTGGWRF